MGRVLKGCLDKEWDREMTKPTKVVTANKELNRWCGTEGIDYYKGTCALSSLFKYAVPKLESWDCIIDWAIEMVHAYADGRTLKDPALALFWVLWGVLKNET